MFIIYLSKPKIEDGTVQIHHFKKNGCFFFNPNSNHLKRITYSDSFKTPEDFKRPRLTFVMISSWISIFKLKEPHAPENMSKTSVVCVLRVTKQMFWCSFVLDLQPESRWFQKSHLLVMWLAEFKTRGVFSVVWCSDLDEVSGSRQKNCP